MNRKAPAEKLESLIQEEGYIHGILRNMDREKREARSALNLPLEDNREDFLWTEAFSIIIDKSLSEEQRAIELKKRFIILERK